MRFGWSEVSTSHNRNPKQRKIVRRHVVIFDEDCVGTAWNYKFRSAKVVTERRALGLRDFGHPRQALNPLPELLHKTLWRALDRSPVFLNPETLSLRRSFQNPDQSLRAVKPAKQQSGGKQQHHAYGDLRADQHAEQKAPTPFACTDLRAVSLHCAVQVEPRGSQCGDKAECDSHDKKN